MKTLPRAYRFVAQTEEEDADGRLPRLQCRAGPQPERCMRGLCSKCVAHNYAPAQATQSSPMAMMGLLYFGTSLYVQAHDRTQNRAH